jgi:hypothetical protein
MRISTTQCHRMQYIIWIVGLIVWGLSSGVTHGAFFRRANKDARQPVNVSKEELRIELNDFTDYFITQTKQASEELDGKLSTTKTRKMTLMWRLRASQALFGALAQDDPVAAFVDAWALCVRLSDFFEHGNAWTGAQ